MRMSMSVKGIWSITLSKGDYSVSKVHDMNICRVAKIICVKY